MIYELSLVSTKEATESDQAEFSKMVGEVIKENGGEVLLEDNWGQRNFAQQTSDGLKGGNYQYFLYRGNGASNVEIIRRLKINEKALKHLVIKLGEDRFQEKIVKAYKSPYSKTHPGSVTDSEDNDGEEGREKKKFTRRRGCWFSSKKFKADWKDPATFTWLINEFGKISPARISGVSRKHQRFATTAVKRARQLGIVSHLSNRVME